MKPSEKIADFVCSYDGRLDIPEVLDRIKASIMDYVGVTVAGAGEESSKILHRVIIMSGGDPQATVWATSLKTSVMMAALANGTAAHALDYDDSNSVMRTHPSVLLLPALFALGEYHHRSGKEIITAYATGFEVGAKLGRALNPELVFQGWLPVGILGTYMQTAACARLLGLDSTQARMALGIATNLASGLRSNNGTMAKPLLAGKVGFNGILATLLAREGMTGNPEALEDRFGFFENYTRKAPSALENAIDTLGESPDIIHTGVTYKPYPSCTGTHMPIECALHIARNHAIDPDEIDKIEVSLSVHARPLLIHPRPKNEMEARFSLEYCICRALLDREMGIRQFASQKLQDSSLWSLIKKVKPIYYEIPDSRKNWEWTRFPVEIRIYLSNGNILSWRVENLKGSLGNPLSRAELKEKFYQCCQGKLLDSQIEKLLNQVNKFEDLEDVSSLAAILEGE